MTEVKNPEILECLERVWDLVSSMYGVVTDVQQGNGFKSSTVEGIRSLMDDLQDEMEVWGEGTLDELREVITQFLQDNAPEPVDTKWYVTIYVTDRAYGGPEEGGWWYNFGVPSDDPNHLKLQRTFGQGSDAENYMHGLDETVGQMNKDEGRRRPSSVLCNGWLEAILTEGPPKPYPEVIPHYE